MLPAVQVNCGDPKMTVPAAPTMENHQMKIDRREAIYAAGVACSSVVIPEQFSVTSRSTAPIESKPAVSAERECRLADEWNRLLSEIAMFRSTVVPAAKICPEEATQYHNSASQLAEWIHYGSERPQELNTVSPIEFGISRDTGLIVWDTDIYSINDDSNSLALLGLSWLDDLFPSILDDLFPSILTVPRQRSADCRWTIRLKEAFSALPIGPTLFNIGCFVLPALAELDPIFCERFLSTESICNRKVLNADRLPSWQCDNMSADHPYIKRGISNILLHVITGLSYNRCFDVPMLLGNPNLNWGYGHLVPRWVLSVLKEKAKTLDRL